MGVLTSKKTTYKFSRNDIKLLISKDLDVPVDAIHVNYVIREIDGDPMDRYPGVNDVTEIEVIVDEIKTQIKTR